MIEQTLVLVKPDGVARGLTGEIIKRIEQRGLKVVGLKMIKVEKDLAKQHYTKDIAEEGENVYNWLLDYIHKVNSCNSYTRIDAIENVRKIVGSTESKSQFLGL